MIDCLKTTNYFAEKRRMTKLTNTGVCAIGCANCPLSEKNNRTGRLCVDYEMHHPEEAISIVQQWSDEHPQRTYLSELLKQYPNAKLDCNGTPKRICPHELGLTDKEDCDKDHNCVECWNQPIEDGEE
ncbi:hypothetical protein [Ruminococcus bromii]|uniref:hypothetical protein n=1 Tax=Ruminococcus bromii TaxID=40518 RepID=UPI00241E24E9|nr:hypothetical protein [Ruminococcus bromii]